jgi:hypothetical protein
VNRPPALALAVVAGLVVAPLAACKSDPRSGERDERSSRSGSAATGAGERDDGRTRRTSPADRAREDRWYRIDALIAEWDAVQQDGRDQDAAVLADKVAAEVDGDFDGVVAALRGEHGVKGEHLGVKAMGFSKRPEATALLVEKLRTEDPSLVANALIELKLRADPETPLQPIVTLLRASFVEARRYAPLALANIAAARERVRRPIEEAFADQAMTGLVGLVQDRDPYVRLHTAKAMGALRRPEATDFLVLLLRDEHVRIRLAAAAALERIGDPRAFPQVVRLMDDVPHDQKAIVRDVLASYAERLQGRPLAPTEVAAMGISPTAWDRWYVDRAKR